MNLPPNHWRRLHHKHANHTMTPLPLLTTRDVRAAIVEHRRSQWLKWAFAIGVAGLIVTCALAWQGCAAWSAAMQDARTGAQEATAQARKVGLALGAVIDSVCVPMYDGSTTDEQVRAADRLCIPAAAAYDALADATFAAELALEADDAAKMITAAAAVARAVEAAVVAEKTIRGAL